MHNLKTVAADCSCNNYFIYLFCVPTIIHMWIWRASYIAAGILTRTRKPTLYINTRTHTVFVSKPGMCVHRCIIEMNTADTNPNALKIIPLMWKRKKSLILIARYQWLSCRYLLWTHVNDDKTKYNIISNAKWFSFFVILASLWNPQKFDNGRFKRTVNLHK